MIIKIYGAKISLLKMEVSNLSYLKLILLFMRLLQFNMYDKNHKNCLILVVNLC